MYVYIKSEQACADNNWHDLWTVGFYKPNGQWEPESDHCNRAAAAERVAWLNGELAAARVMDEALNSGDGVYRP